MWLKFVCLLLRGSCKNGFVKILDYRKDAPVQNTEDFINRKVGGGAGRQNQPQECCLQGESKARKVPKERRP